MNHTKWSKSSAPTPVLIDLVNLNSFDWLHNSINELAEINLPLPWSVRWYNGCPEALRLELRKIRSICHRGSVFSRLGDTLYCWHHISSLGTTVSTTRLSKSSRAKYHVRLAGGVVRLKRGNADHLKDRAVSATEWGLEDQPDTRRMLSDEERLWRRADGIRRLKSPPSTQDLRCVRRRSDCQCWFICWLSWHGIVRR